MKRILVTLLLGTMGIATSAAQAGPPNFDQSTRNFRDLLSALVKADTSNPPGNEARAVKILSSRLKSHGIKFQVMDFGPGRQNLVARLKGSGELKPLLLLSHLDVVGADHQNWTVPPHEVTEKDGYLYGRGVSDDLGMGVANMETFLNIKESGINLRRDLIIAFTGDEESQGSGIIALLKQHPDWIDAELVLNEGGGVTLDETGHPSFVQLTTSEKIYQDFTLVAHGTTGHSSVPKGENAIYKLARAMTKLSQYKPKERLLPVTRAFLKERARVEKPEVAKAMRAVAESRTVLPRWALNVLEKNPSLGPLFYTTCIPTLINGGTRNNALPSEATANINCRILPDETVEQTHKMLEAIVADPSIEIHFTPEEGIGGVSSEVGAVPDAVRKIAQREWGDLPVIPGMVLGASDSRFLHKNGMQAYGLSPIAESEADSSRDHGIDERIAVSSVRPALEFMYNLVSELAAQSSTEKPK
jgi:acetylornithine deacetylase/succinyl-diaminopimelate desuccinylase-like protein